MKDKEIKYFIGSGERSGDMMLRKCKQCKKEYESHVMIADYTSIACLECKQCSNLVWYDTDFDPIWQKNLDLDKHPQEIENIVESYTPPCNKCGGKLEHIDWYLYGAPVRCPFCRANQEELKNSLGQAVEYRDNRWKFKEEVREKYNKLVFKRDD